MNNHHILQFQQQLDIFVTKNNLLPADAILVRKAPLKLLRHYIIYLGKNNFGYHIFMANTLSGVKVYNYQQLMNELKTFVPERIDRFIGSSEERKEAINRALKRKDEDSYNLILNNCEHFKNWVQKGEHQSSQVSTFGTVALIAIGLSLLFTDGD